MPEYLAPGVYIEEISTGAMPIAGVSTSTAGFVGQTERGPTKVRMVTSWLDFQRWYGGHLDRNNSATFSYLPHAIQGFFDNGGQRAFIARVTPPQASGDNADGSSPARFALPTSDGSQSLQVEALGEGDWGNRIWIRVGEAQRPTGQNNFRLTIIYYRVQPPLPGDQLVDPFDDANIANPNRRDPDVVEDYDNLGVDPLGPGYVLTTVNSASRLIQLEWVNEENPPAAPNLVAFPNARLGGGTNGATAISVNEYFGEAADPGNADSYSTGLTALDEIDEISLLCVPDEVLPVFDTDRAALRDQIINQCELRKDRFAVLQHVESPGEVQNIPVIRDTSYAAVYYPWIEVYDPVARDPIYVPPGGHITGIYARTDIERGVHKAPANEVLRGASNLRLPITKGMQDILNPRGVNCIRDFRPDGRSIRVWGARTMSSDGQWKYVNVRRLFIFVEESIDEGTQWVVFEPNDEPLWDRVRRSITNFLVTIWRNGALMGATQEEAFFVKCDRTTMTQDDIDNGRLICYIGMAPVKPAEFVIFRFSQKTLEAQS